MRSITALILIMLTVRSLAGEVELVNEVWIDGSSFYKSISHKKQSTIYFENWDFYAQQFLDDEDYHVALQLNTAFDPLPEDEVALPNLTTLAAISSESILMEYLSFLERFGRTKGINFMVLPDTIGLSNFEKQVLRKARIKSAYYFLDRSFLSREVPETKKEFEGLDHTIPTIWLTTQDHNFSRIRKWSAKKSKRQEGIFVESLKRSIELSFIPAYDLPESLKKDLVRNGVIAIDNFNRLPLKSKELVYLGDDEELKYWLSRYAKVYENTRPGVQRIVDLRGGQQQFGSEDIVLSQQVLEKEVSQLIVPLNYEGIEMDLGKMLFGGLEIKGRHPEAHMIRDHHVITYAESEWEGLSDTFKRKLDSISQHAITNFATPGIQLAVVKNGSMVFDKSYGYYSYDSMKQVESKTLYDLASLTKVIATLPAIAYLVDQGLIALEDSVGKHLPDFVGSNKSSITIKQLLAHQGGLKSYIPFWSMMMDGDRLDAFYYKTPEDEALDRRSYGYEPDPVLLDTLKRYIIKSKLIKNKESYNYSDLGFMILHMIVEKVADQPLDEFLKDKFYGPMGLENLCFNPINQGVIHESITPTEYDERFRDYQVWGEVHDRNAAVFGGVAGHAGLFSNAADLAKMMSMLLNDGVYGGRRYLSAEVLKKFNLRYYDENRRGLGWDKKDGNKDSASPYASDQSFGHTGFTGTMVWADPVEDLIFIFLSNRIYPDANNWRLSDYNTRTEMHNAIYEAIISPAGETK